MSTRTALVAGPTGLVGRELVAQLLRHPDYALVRALSRRPLSHDEGRLRTVITDYSDLDAQRAELAADDVFCCLGTTIRRAGSRAAFERVDYRMVVDLALAAQRAGATRLVVISAAGASHTGVFYSRVKARMEDAVSQVPYRAVHILRPSLLMGEREESRPGERFAQRLAPFYAPLLTGALARYRPVEATDVAQAMIRLALEGADGVHVHHLPLKI